MNTTTNKNLDLAMAAAREYKEIRERDPGEKARLAQLRDNIDGWVGKWQTVDGKDKLVIPDVVRAAMGLD